MEEFSRSKNTEKHKDVCHCLLSHSEEFFVYLLSCIKRHAHSCITKEAVYNAKPNVKIAQTYLVIRALCHSSQPERAGVRFSYRKPEILLHPEKQNLGTEQHN